MRYLKTFENFDNDLGRFSDDIYVDNDDDMVDPLDCPSCDDIDEYIPNEEESDEFADEFGNKKVGRYSGMDFDSDQMKNRFKNNSMFDDDDMDDDMDDNDGMSNKPKFDFEDDEDIMDDETKVWGDEIVEKKKINAGFQAYLDKQKAKNAKKGGKDDKEDDKEYKKAPKGLTAKQKKLPEAMQKAILKRQGK